MKKLELLAIPPENMDDQFMVSEAVLKVKYAKETQNNDRWGDGEAVIMKIIFKLTASLTAINRRRVRAALAPQCLLEMTPSGWACHGTSISSI